MTDRLLLTKRDLAGLLQVSTRSIERLTRAGELPPPIRIGSAVRWDRAAIEAWISAKGGGQ